MSWKRLLKMILLVLLTGIGGGVAGALFHVCLDAATSARILFRPLIYFLPVAGLCIVLLYQALSIPFDFGTKQTVQNVRKDGIVPARLGPGIFASSILTHLCGGSAGREGAALQLGGSLGAMFAKMAHADRMLQRLTAMAGMSAVFSALFGTPFAATVFCSEILWAGRLSLIGIATNLIASLLAVAVTRLFGIEAMAYEVTLLPKVSLQSVLLTLVLALLCAGLSVIFCFLLHKGSHYASRFLPNPYLRVICGGILIIALSFLFPSGDYNGAGTDVIARAIGGSFRPEAFAVKILFTVVTLSSGYRGGEIVPMFFVGALFGALFGSLVGLPVGFCAALGMIFCFCAATKAPVASFLMSLELFGAVGIPFFLIGCIVSFFASGNIGFYDRKVYPMFQKRG